ncbi:protein of unknown function [Actinobaculum suis]|uniref:G5 domain-containing protein n=1 Tax=Actinobaculum suis TaxID=1657 RepID=A0A0K9ESD5_9ACTO|nr:G5 domain-containing protein [Actinobaculum suis]KMY22800.1 hypothetical protein ACU19_08060 [Actinobaculum suis]MDY5153618.1 G5 domain-containing protein [Actinobaculum suis]OCA93121.1 hypothetical protein ACU21_01335 [Actinobaculum suis]OCA93237.1 hypothetical protein ACU20_02455 [Actinobaculum suis]SDE23528.1 protein of unknown function [Actinobaculum suis]
MGRHGGENSSISERVARSMADAPKPGTRRALILAEREAQEAAAIAATQIAKNTSTFARVGTTATNVPSSLLARSTAALASVLIAAPTVAFAAGTMGNTAQAATDNQPDPAQKAHLLAANNAAKTVTFVFDGTSKTITTTAPTLHDALQEAGIQVDGDDVVSQELAAPVTDGSTVNITRVEYKMVTEEVVDAHETSEVEDAALPQGERDVETAGQDGVSANTYQIRVENGKEVSRTLHFTAQKQQRVDEVVKVGTAAPSARENTGGNGGGAPSGAVAVPAGSAQEIAAGMLSSYGWGGDQFSCLVTLWNRESGWNHLAQNPSSSAYGIPQALPGSKMASAGADWRTNPATQIKWGLGYIQGRYGTPCGALAHSNSVGWY